MPVQIQQKADHTPAANWLIQKIKIRTGIPLTRLVCAHSIRRAPWLKPYSNDTYLMYMLQQLEHRSLLLTSTMAKLSLVFVYCAVFSFTLTACDTFLEGRVPLGHCKTLHCDRLHALSPAHSVASQVGVLDVRKPDC